MKVGILTFHRAHNYGAVLQAYALQHVIKKIGHDVSFVDFEMPEMHQVYLWNKGIRSVVNKHPIYSLISMPGKKKKYEKFEKFINNCLSCDNHGIDNLDSIYDVIVIGSDQVFNSKITKGIENPYWGVIPSFSKKIISYAASTEYFEMSESQKKQMSRLLSRFSAISVRENLVKEMLSPYTDIDISIDIDPTLLLDISDWTPIITKPKISDNYVFYYYVRKNDNVLKMAQEFARQRGLKLVVLSSLDYYRSTINALDSGPSEFLGWVKNADYVITSSFHATVFSLIFNKTFFCVSLKDGYDGRVYSLLESLDLTDNIIKIGDEIVDRNIDWTKVNNLLNKIPQSSIEYLIKNLKNE